MKLNTAVCLAVLASAATAVPFADAECCLDRNQRRPLCLSLPSYPNPMRNHCPICLGNAFSLTALHGDQRHHYPLGTTSNGLANLCVSDNSVWDASWALRSVDDDTWTTCRIRTSRFRRFQTPFMKSI